MALHAAVPPRHFHVAAASFLLVVDQPETGSYCRRPRRILMGVTVWRPGMKTGPPTRESRITPSPCRIVRLFVAAALTLGGVQGATGQPTPTGEAVMAWPVTISPTWFDPSTAPPQITPFGMLYALHDALVRPLPGQKMGNSLAESWTESPDGLTYEFKLHRGLKFHNGDPVTAEDVKFSFERYKGAGARELTARVRLVETVD